MSFQKMNGNIVTFETDIYQILFRETCDQG